MPRLFVRIILWQRHLLYACCLMFAVVAEAAPVSFTTASTNSAMATFPETMPFSTPTHTLTVSNIGSRAINFAISGTDEDLFTLTEAINGIAVIAFITPPDFENPGSNSSSNSYSLTVEASHAGTADSASLNLTVEVTNVDEPPVFINPSDMKSIAENLPTVTFVATFNAVDPESSTVSYGLSGDDATSFNIDSSSGALTFARPPDFEMPGSQATTNTYSLEIVASATTSPNAALSSTHALTIEVTDVDEPPFFASTALSSFYFPVNRDITAPVVTFAAMDDAGDTVSYALSGTDMASFGLDSSSGALTFNSAPTKGSTYSLTVTASSTGSSGNPMSDTHNFTVTVTGSNPPVFTNPGTTRFYFPENTDAAVAVAMLTATDVEGDPITYSLTGFDHRFFTLDLNGVLRFKISPDFEMPRDKAAGNSNSNEYLLTATASSMDASRTLTASYDFTVEVTDITELSPGSTANAPPAFASDTPVSLLFSETTAITTPVTILTVTDAENDPISFRLLGPDGSLFRISEAIDGIGALAFMQAPDFEMPGSKANSNLYSLIIEAGSMPMGGLAQTARHRLTVEVTDADEPPVFIGSPPRMRSVAENLAVDTSVATFSARDPERASVTFSLSGDDATSFNIDSSSGVLTFARPPDFEMPGSQAATNTYSLIIQAKSRNNPDADELSLMHALMIEVTNVDEPPFFTNNTPSEFYFAENADITVPVVTFTAMDDMDDMVNYALSGADTASFVLDPDMGALTFDDSLDLAISRSVADTNVYSLTVTVSSTGTSNVTQMSTHDFTVTVTGSSPPVFTSTETQFDFVENTPATTPVTRLTATDAENDPVTYSLTGDDEQFFVLNPDGNLHFKTIPDFEMPRGMVLSSSNINEYRLTATASSLDMKVMLTATHHFVVVVTNVDNEPLVFTNTLTQFDFVENTPITITVAELNATHDIPGAVITYELLGADAQLFTLGMNTGILTFKAVPDFEMPRSAAGNNIYRLVARATSTAPDNSMQSSNHDFQVTVTNADDAPAFASDKTSFTFAEDTDIKTPVATLTAADPDGDTVTYSLPGMMDGEYFEISDMGVLTFRTTPDFEMPRGAPAAMSNTNLYRLKVEVSSMAMGATRLTAALDIEVTVTDAMEMLIAVMGMPGQNGVSSIFQAPVTATTDTFVTESLDKAFNAVGFSQTGRTWEITGISIVGGAAVPLTTFTIDAENRIRVGVGVDISESYSLTICLTVGATSCVTGANKPAHVSSVTARIEIRFDTPGMVTLDTTKVFTGGQITATLMDADGSVQNQNWQWQRVAPDMTDWADIAGATQNSYVPVAPDIGSELRATVSYEDAIGPNQTAQSTRTSAVVVNSSGQQDTATVLLAAVARVLATDALDVIGTRMDSTDNEFIVGGLSLNLAPSPASWQKDARGVAYTRDQVGLAQTHQRALMFSPYEARAVNLVGQGVSSDAPDAIKAGSFWQLLHESRRLARANVHKRSIWDLVGNSKFSYALFDGGQNQEGGGWSFWGQGGLNVFTSKAGPRLKNDGLTSFGYLGIEKRLGLKHLFGVTYSRSDSDFDFNSGLVGAGTLKASLDTAYFYGQTRPRESLSIWAIGGVGTGDLTWTPILPVKTSLDLGMVALGIRQVFDIDAPFSLAVKGDGFYASLSSAAVPGLPKISAEASRLRIAVEGTATSIDRAIIPSVETGLRIDGGDAETGVGLDLAGALKAKVGPLTLAGRLQFLLVHQQSSFHDFSLNFNISYDQGNEGSGLIFSLAPAWGSSQNQNAESALWHQNRLLPEVATGKSSGAMRTAFKLSYGIQAGRAKVTPFSEIDLLGFGAQRFKAGTRFDFGAAHQFSFNLYGERLARTTGTDKGAFVALTWRYP